VERSGSSVTDTTIVVLTLLLGGFFWLITWLPSLGLRQAGDDWNIPAEVSARANPVVLSSDVLMRGREQYLFTCAKCHGFLADGHGPMWELMMPRPLNFTHREVQIRTDGDLFYIISTGRDTMPEYGSRTTETEIWELVHYIRATVHLPGHYDESDPNDLILNPGIITTARPDTPVTPIPLIGPIS
jgi:mono/diheme cytochrome c family protein